MKTKWMKAAKAILGIVIALVLLDAFCYWYYNPAEYDWDESRATDTIREPGAFTSRAKEGIAWATMDEYGYNNADIPGEDGVFVLMMGSSHTEGLNVMQHETVPSQLQDQLAGNGLSGSVYNLGMSSHIFTRNAANLDRALERFAPKGYVVLETQHVKISKTSIEDAVNDSFDRLLWTKPVIAEWISDRPLVRTLYRQWSSLASGSVDEEADVVVEITDAQLEQYQEALTKLLVQMRETADKHHVTPIIYYHPHLILQADGSAVSDTHEGCRAAFTAACEAAGIRFLDMTDIFLDAYAQEHRLPHGFTNTSPGTGHLNAYGNRLIAEALCAEICNQEAAK